MNWGEAEVKIVANLEKARAKIEKISEEPLTMEEIYEHLRANPNGCEFGRGCDVCMAAKGYPVENP